MLAPLPALVTPIAVTAVAVATEVPGTFFAQHPDASMWIMSTLVSLVCLMAINSYRKLCLEIKELKAMTAENIDKTNINETNIAVLHRICEEREKLCPIYHRGEE